MYKFREVVHGSNKTRSYGRGGLFALINRNNGIESAKQSQSGNKHSVMYVEKWTLHLYNFFADNDCLSDNAGDNLFLLILMT